MHPDIMLECSLDHWIPSPGDRPDGDFETSLESGGILYFPRLSFAFMPAERRFLREEWSDGRSKNISLHGKDALPQGARGSVDDIVALGGLMQRFAARTESLLTGLLPRYAGHLHKGFTSYRNVNVEGRVTRWRKDDTRLHIDSFPSNPTGGLRLLRVFTNVNPEGLPRVWRVGEPFADYASRFFPRASRPFPGLAWLLNCLGVTKTPRSEYDHYMGQLHDLGKADAEYQANSPQRVFEFPAGSTWVVFSDQVLHAVMAGQFMLEQTFFLDPDAMVTPALGPLPILEGLAGRPLGPKTRN